jgi:hypothetical protein
MAKVIKIEETGDPPKSGLRQLTLEEGEEWLKWYREYRFAIMRGDRPEYRTRDSFAK